MSRIKQHQGAGGSLGIWTDKDSPQRCADVVSAKLGDPASL
jgi:hypothetical protein